MTRNRLEAFSDGVLAIIITIMVLELNVPHDPSWDALRAILAHRVVGILVDTRLPALAMALCATVAIVWLVPDRRFERSAHIERRAVPGGVCRRGP